jgi:hypothetical protein
LIQIKAARGGLLIFPSLGAVKDQAELEQLMEERRTRSGPCG